MSSTTSTVNPETWKGRRGKPLAVTTNAFEITRLPTRDFFQYDGTHPSEVPLASISHLIISQFVSTYDGRPSVNSERGTLVIRPEVENRKRRGEIIDRLQSVTATNIFTPQAIYDGNAILFSSYELQLGGGGAATARPSLQPWSHSVKLMVLYSLMSRCRTSRHPQAPRGAYFKFVLLVQLR